MWVVGVCTPSCLWWIYFPLGNTSFFSWDELIPQEQIRSQLFFLISCLMSKLHTIKCKNVIYYLIL